MSERQDWPARAYAYGTWAYALNQTLERVDRARQKMYVYKGELDGEIVWVGSWDPKPAAKTPAVKKAPAVRHMPRVDGTCSLLCNCPTPLTKSETSTLHDLGLF